jgi:peptide/nickel transport system permease protein
MIRNALPWTVGLLGAAILVSWCLGICLGTLAAYHPRSVWAKALTAGLVTVYPIPYFILGLILLIVFAFYVPIFPLGGGASGSAALSMSYLGSLAYHAALPLLSLVVLGTAFRFIIARAIAGTVASSDYVNFAEIAGLPKRTIVIHYLMRNTLMPQVTDLALSIGAIFEGALITEIIFSYPGLGYLLYTGILSGDYNLILGVTLFSIIGVATATLVLDFIYPLVDPRVRYG